MEQPGYYQEYSDTWPANSSIEYQVLYNNCGSGGYSFWTGGQQLPLANNYCISDYAPTGATMAGGIGSLADQMPGNTSNYMHFNYANVYTSGWQAFNGIESDPQSGTFGYNAPNASTLEIRDWRCFS